MFQTNSLTVSLLLLGLCFQNMNLILMIHIVNTFFNCVVNISGLDLIALYLYAGNHDECLRLKSIG